MELGLSLVLASKCRTRTTILEVDPPWDGGPFGWVTFELHGKSSAEESTAASTRDTTIL
jgi:hypothetical protein